jgi:hypothetical protein
LFRFCSTGNGLAGGCPTDVVVAVVVPPALLAMPISYGKRLIRHPNMPIRAPFGCSNRNSMLLPSCAVISNVHNPS